MVTYTALNENWENFLERDKGLKGSRPKVSLRLMKVCNQELIQLFLFFEPDQKIEIFFEKEGAAEESNVDFEIGVNAPAAKQCCRLRKISYRAYVFFLLFGHLKRIAFYLLFGCPTANFGLLSRGKPLLLNVNHCVLTFLNCRSPGALLRSWVRTIQ